MPLSVVPPDSWIDRLKRVFSIDLRSLALFRVLLGVLVLWDLGWRTADIPRFLTDAGVLPRTVAWSLNSPWQWSLHAASGTALWQAMLFTVAAGAAVGLILGYRSRAMAAITFVLLASLLNRNTWVLHGGDQLLVVMSFWSLFLPLGARYSVDAALQPANQHDPNRQDDTPQTCFSVATIATVVQVLSLYIFTALLKSGAAWRVNFDAALYAVSLQHYATELGHWIRQFPGFLKVATAGVLLVEFLAPLLVVLPVSARSASGWRRAFAWPRTRIIGLLLLASLHIAFLLMLYIGLFPLIDLMALSILIPGSVWQALSRRQRAAKRKPLLLYYDQNCDFCLKMCLILRELLLGGDGQILPAQQTPAIGRVLERENSWVVVDGNGQQYLHWQAMQCLMTQRWPFKPLGWLMALPPLMWAGQHGYRQVARHRHILGRISASHLPYRSQRLTPTFPGQCAALFCLYVITAYNLTGLPTLQHWRAEHVTLAAMTLRINQQWDMFAPYPLRRSMYPQIRGTLRNGEPVNLYPLTQPSENWESPTLTYPLFEHYRWRKYYGHVMRHRDNALRRALGSFICRSWNHDGRDSAQQLATLEILFTTRPTRTDGTVGEDSQRRVWRHWCFAEFAEPDT